MKLSGIFQNFNHENFFKGFIILRKNNIVRSIQIMTVCSLGNKGEYKTGILIKDKYKTREFCQLRKYYLVKKQIDSMKIQQYFKQK